MFSSFDVVSAVLQANPSIEYLTLVAYEGGPNWGDVNPTLDRNNFELLVNGLEQDRGDRILTRLSRSEVSAGYLRSLAEKLPEGKLLGLLSAVSPICGGGIGHIPMMDFKCSASQINLELLVHLLEGLAQGRGFVLESGRSYHYYGTQVLTEKEWRTFLGRCLLMSGYSDDRYIGHQLVDGYCVLRLSSGKWKNRLPKVVAEIL